jgi:ribosomal protein S27E
VKLLEDLKQKYPIQNIPLYGECIVVPGRDFDPDFEVELGDHGYKCFDTFLDGKPVTLVRVAKTERDSGEKTVYSPPPAAKASAEGEKETLIPRASPSSRWRPEEDEVLVKLWNERGLIEKMTPSFPGRTEAAIRLRIQRLEKYGKIKKRAGRPKGLKSSVRRWSDQEEQLLIELWNKDTKVPDMLAHFPGRTRNSVAMRIDVLQKSGGIKPKWKAGEGIHHRPDQSTEESANRPVHTPSPPPAKDEVVELLKQILEAVKPQEEFVSFESYCPSCRDERSVHDESNVWKACPICGGPLTVWNVETVKEASS